MEPRERLTWQQRHRVEYDNSLVITAKPHIMWAPLKGYENVGSRLTDQKCIIHQSIDNFGIYVGRRLSNGKRNRALQGDVAVTADCDWYDYDALCSVSAKIAKLRNNQSKSNACKDKQPQSQNQDNGGLTENDGHENDGPKMTAWREVAGEQADF